jgi:hypothetical protein
LVDVTDLWPCGYVDWKVWRPLESYPVLVDVTDLWPCGYVDWKVWRPLESGTEVVGIILPIPRAGL